MYKITLATGNLNKVKEINLIARDYDIEFVLPKGEFNPVEDGNTFQENAYCKALCASKIGETELYLADDSGLCVDKLNNEPGIYSARYAKTPSERIEKLLKNMENIIDRTAHFSCAMVICDKSGKKLFETIGYCYGEILKEKRGENGFGYDPIFYVKDEKMGMAELSPDRKSKISHRAKALNKVLKFLKAYLNK